MKNNFFNITCALSSIFVLGLFASACKTEKSNATAETTKIVVDPNEQKRLMDSAARAEVISYDPSKLPISENLPSEVKTALRNLETKKFSDGSLGQQFLGFAKAGHYDFGDKMKFVNLKFTRGTADIQESSAVEIDELADVMMQFPKLNIVLESHTDNELKPAKSEQVSQARADAIRAKLVAKGIDEARIKAQGFGQKFPVGDNSRMEGKLINDRVEIQILRFI